MKHCIVLILASAIMIPLLSDSRLSASEKTAPDNINVEEIPGTTGKYLVNIKFTEIDAVSVYAFPKTAQKQKALTLQAGAWSYDKDSDILTVNEKIDANRIIRVSGKYQTPLCIIAHGITDPAEIRMVVEGHIGVEGKDYLYDAASHRITLSNCTTGKESYILQYPRGGGASSIGSISPASLDRKQLQHMRWPLEGNTDPIGSDGRRFSLRDGHFSSVLFVQLIPAEDGYTGHDLQTGFLWDGMKGVLTLDSPVDLKKYSVFICGEE